MKTTIVPAQVTSVEDRIAGNLSFKQLLLMIVPVFLSAALFAFLPPFASFQIYKAVISVAVLIVCLALALRIKSRLVVDWVVILSRYNLRPRFYVYNKNNQTARMVIAKQQAAKAKTEQTVTQPKQIPQFAHNTNDEMTFEERLGNPAANLHFTFSKKGGLRVHIKEIR